MEGQHRLHHDRSQSRATRLSTLARTAQLSLPELVRLIRGETLIDPRPNKALCPATYQFLLSGYKHLDLLLEIAKNGFRASWHQPRAQQESQPPNHRSATACADQVRQRLSEGEAQGTYLIVDADIFDHWAVHVSPFGAIAKSGEESQAIRLIHDLSFPAGNCPNDITDTESLPALSYEPVSTIATRIEALRHRHPTARILILKGDVHGAFRHLRHHADDVAWMGGRAEDGDGVVDLSAPFGWTGSPAFYGVFGEAICHIVRGEWPARMHPGHCTDNDPFFAYAWVDDHILVEVDIGDRCTIAEDALRLAMLAVLGPHAINEDKFSSWASRLTALGLEWDTQYATVSIPEDKIAKARLRVAAVQRRDRVSKHDLEKLLGSLRHVASCIYAARPFYQRLQALVRRVPRHGSVELSGWAKDDLRWFNRILEQGRLRGVPTRLFGPLPQPDVHWYMDASDTGCCVLDPGQGKYLVVQFDPTERAMITAGSPGPSFDINVREHLSIALAAVLLAPIWCATLAPTWPHIRCWTATGQRPREQTS